MYIQMLPWLIHNHTHVLVEEHKSFPPPPEEEHKSFPPPNLPPPEEAVPLQSTPPEEEHVRTREYCSTCISPEGEIKCPRRHRCKTCKCYLDDDEWFGQHK